MKPKEFIEEIWGFFGFPDGLFKDKAIAHAMKLWNYYYIPLKEIIAEDEKFLDDSLWLFMASYFLDDAFDTDERPYALAIGLYLYSEYVRKVQIEHPDKIELLKEYYRIQMIYQSAEKDRENEKGFKLEYVHDPEKYHMKQIILLFPLELIDDGSKEKIYNMFIHYFCCILITDDIMDAKEDISSDTLTSVTIGCENTEDLDRSIKNISSILFEKMENVLEMNKALKQPSQMIVNNITLFKNIVSDIIEKIK